MVFTPKKKGRKCLRGYKYSIDKYFGRWPIVDPRLGLVLVFCYRLFSLPGRGLFQEPRAASREENMNDKRFI